MKRIIPFALIVVLLLLIVPVNAQAEIKNFCGDLSEADCALLTESAAAMQALESTTFSLDANITISNIANMPFEDMNFKLSGAGSTAADMGPFVDMKPEDFLGGNAAIYPMVADMLRAVAADMTFTLDLPPELRELMKEQDQVLPESLSLDMRMVDGVAYVNLADIAAAAPEAKIPPGWMGIDLGEFYETIVPKMMEDMSTSASFDMVPMMTSLMQAENIGAFVAIERMADAEIDGQTMAAFETRLDYLAMLEIPEFQEALLSMAGEEEANDALEVIRAMYEGLDLVIIQNIGVDDKLIHSTEVQMHWDLASFGEVTKQGDLPALAFNMLLTEESFNDAPEVVAPEDATLLPLEDMMPSPSK